MCGRYYRRSDKQRIAEAFHLGTLDDIPLEAAPSYNIAPTTMQPAIRNNRDTGEREMVAMRWGMVPNFAKSLADFKGFSTINAKAETLLSKPLWRVPFHRRRCLVPADGFYEWKRLDEKTKQPYAFALRSGEPFAFGSLGRMERPRDRRLAPELQHRHHRPQRTHRERTRPNARDIEAVRLRPMAGSR